MILSLRAGGVLNFFHFLSSYSYQSQICCTAQFAWETWKWGEGQQEEMNFSTDGWRSVFMYIAYQKRLHWKKLWFLLTLWLHLGIFPVSIIKWSWKKNWFPCKTEAFIKSAMRFSFSKQGKEKNHFFVPMLNWFCIQLLKKGKGTGAEEQEKENYFRGIFWWGQSYKKFIVFKG